MNKETRKALEAAGFAIGDAGDFLGLTAEEREMVRLRIAASKAVRRLREKNNLSQVELAKKIGSSQSRIAKIEAGTSGVSLDLLFRGLFAAGGKLKDLTEVKPTRREGTKRSRKAVTSER